jgi:hypothetical protein
MDLGTGNLVVLGRLLMVMVGMALVLILKIRDLICPG